jgi:hypothetical protein
MDGFAVSRDPNFVGLAHSGLAARDFMACEGFKVDIILWLNGLSAIWTDHSRLLYEVSSQVTCK